jgi:hypothetical protein
MTSAKFSPETQTNNEFHQASQNTQPHNAPIVSAMASTVKFIQEELWIREWESKNTWGRDEQRDGEDSPMFE